MASPKARRRQRNTRLTIAALLICVAALAVVGAVLTGSFVWTAIAGFVAVVLGAGAARMTHTELMTARRDANRDRAEQAQAYHQVAVERSIDHAAYMSNIQKRIAGHESTIEQLETALTSAQRRAAESARLAQVQADRIVTLESDVAIASQSLDDSETRAAEAILQVLELEQEIDVLKSELTAWQTSGQVRRHA